MGYGAEILMLTASIGLYEAANVLRLPCVPSGIAGGSLSRGTLRAVGQGHRRRGR